MKTILRKNLISHKKKNRLTAIIYALSLGSIIFLMTSANLEVNIIVGMTSEFGADIRIEGERYVLANYSEPGVLKASDVDPILQNYSNYISSFAYVSESTTDFYDNAEAKIGDLARIANDSMYFRGVSPSSLFDDSI